jgi:hypothetical protein
MKTNGGLDVYIHVFLTSALVGGEWSASHPGRFTAEEKASDAHWIGGWVGPRAGLDDVEKRKFLTLPGLELRLFGRPARSQSLYRLSYPGSRLNMVEKFSDPFRNRTSILWLLNSLPSHCTDLFIWLKSLRKER